MLKTRTLCFYLESAQIDFCIGIPIFKNEAHAAFIIAASTFSDDITMNIFTFKIQFGIIWQATILLVNMDLKVC